MKKVKCHRCGDQMLPMQDSHQCPACGTWEDEITEEEIEKDLLAEAKDL